MRIHMIVVVDCMHVVVVEWDHSSLSQSLASVEDCSPEAVSAYLNRRLDTEAG